MFELQDKHAKATKTLDNLAVVVAGWKSDLDKQHHELASTVDATADSLVQLEKKFDQLCDEVGARPSKCQRNRSRSRGRGGCHCAIVRYNGQTDRRLKRGDEVFLRPRHGGEPTLKRYFFKMNRCGFSELSTDKAGKVRFEPAVRKHEMFIKTELCQSCCHGR